VLVNENRLELLLYNVNYKQQLCHSFGNVKLVHLVYVRLPAAVDALPPSGEVKQQLGYFRCN
jgi:hypothetical protein